MRIYTWMLRSFPLLFSYVSLLSVVYNSVSFLNSYYCFSSETSVSHGNFLPILSRIEEGGFVYFNGGKCQDAIDIKSSQSSLQSTTYHINLSCNNGTKELNGNIMRIFGSSYTIYGDQYMEGYSYPGYLWSETTTCSLKRGFYPWFFFTSISFWVLITVFCNLACFPKINLYFSCFSNAFVVLISDYLVSLGVIKRCSWVTDSPYISGKSILIIDSSVPLSSKLSPIFDFTTPFTTLFSLSLSGGRYRVYTNFKGNSNVFVVGSKDCSSIHEILSMTEGGKIPVSFPGHSHFLSPSEVVEAVVSRSSRLILRQQVDDSRNIYLSEGLLEKHNRIFFKGYNKYVLNWAKSRSLNPRIDGIGNSEWKLYISDLYFHLGVRPKGVKVHKYGPSSSLLSALKEMEEEKKGEAVVVTPQVTVEKGIKSSNKDEDREVKDKECSTFLNQRTLYILRMKENKKILKPSKVSEVASVSSSVVLSKGSSPPNIDGFIIPSCKEGGLSKFPYSSYVSECKKVSSVFKDLDYLFTGSLYFDKDDPLYTSYWLDLMRCRFRSDPCSPLFDLVGYQPKEAQWSVSPCCGLTESEIEFLGDSSKMSRNPELFKDKWFFRLGEVQRLICLGVNSKSFVSESSRRSAIREEKKKIKIEEPKPKRPLVKNENEILFYSAKRVKEVLVKTKCWGKERTFTSYSGSVKKIKNFFRKGVEAYVSKELLQIYSAKGKPGVIMSLLKKFVNRIVNNDDFSGMSSPILYGGVKVSEKSIWINKKMFKEIYDWSRGGCAPAEEAVVLKRSNCSHKTCNGETLSKIYDDWNKETDNNPNFLNKICLGTKEEIIESGKKAKIENYEERNRRRLEQEEQMKIRSKKSKQKQKQGQSSFINEENLGGQSRAERKSIRKIAKEVIKYESKMHKGRYMDELDPW